MKFADFDALSFDCYGTLIDWEAGIASFVHPWASAQGCTLNREQLLAAYADQESDAEAACPTERYPDILARSLAKLSQRLGLTVTVAEMERFGFSVPDWPAFNDSARALVSLQNTHRLIILSNVDRQSFAASQARLGVDFDAVITAEDVGSYKPDPRNFEALTATIQNLGIQSEKVLHVAQSLFHDHVPAKAAGLATVWIDRRHDRPGWGATPEPAKNVKPDYVFPSMNAFAAAVHAEKT